MLIAAGVRHVPTSTTTRTSPTPIASPLTLFKALQLVHAKELETALERYVTFDLETTDSDVATCGVVELGAARRRRTWRRRCLSFRSEEHTSEFQSQSNLVCRLLLEKKK